MNVREKRGAVIALKSANFKLTEIAKWLKINFKKRVHNQKLNAVTN